MNNKIHFLTSGAGGWGFADYTAYLEIYKEKLQELNLKGIVIFTNISFWNICYDSSHDYYYYYYCPIMIMAPP